MGIAWEVEVTSGMCGQSIDKEFLAGLSLDELGYLFQNLDRCMDMVKQEAIKRV